ncbi:3-deoxy-manno-octulosonate cytidylyltransferase (CMP-KDO synthetase) [Desulfacinum hydrothermale DSM 13146]|uniref:3-deoxy-manno-octulosonate cytidylyltransferase n=1 Tax=Desulfacinum hydrothermale DSM 13146 TaxID=1121390 RepID=A0A1W1XMR7_9BACT|nr:3-deoxy-manno-octulosonate cytidylyltransferase [Desulfacinum hydrothermale]SMC25172.1 3-deoxy-manno-octulosonate cytidylyltransferase (CMP-KDO synthetase) [Desulfacinum hydrothermale DSM 13146]
MAVVAIIPARYASTRFPGKPLAPILGQPMIQWVYERARQCRRLDRVVVATDDGRILEAVRSFGGEAVMTRTDHSSGTDRLAEAAHILGLQAHDLVVNIQGDEPGVSPEMIEALIAEALRPPLLAMATLAFPCQSAGDYTDPNVVKVVRNAQGNALYFSRSPIPCRRDAQDEPMTFLKHLGLYAYRKEFLCRFTRLAPTPLERMERLEQLRALEHGYTIRVGLSPSETVGVDTPEDLRHAERRLKS